MAQIPDDERHKLQIAAGTIGRTRGHDFEEELARAIELTQWVAGDIQGHKKAHRVIGNPAVEIVRYMALSLGLDMVDQVRAWWLGGLATSGLGDILDLPDGTKLTKSKTDVLVEITRNGVRYVKGVSVKTCSNPKPTNDQLYFSTASAFSGLLRSNDIPITAEGETALKMFCGDAGYRPADLNGRADSRVDPARWFYEELPQAGREDLENILTHRQADVTRLLLQLAYPNDPHPPEYLVHLTRKSDDVERSDLAIFAMDELIAHSCESAGFGVKPYRIRKGRFKSDPNAHNAPRFGFVQFQRGGQKQHPTQLQFNLQAGYFDKLLCCGPVCGKDLEN